MQSYRAPHHIDFAEERNQPEQFPSQSYLEIPDDQAEDEVIHSLNAMVEKAMKNGLPSLLYQRIENMVKSYAEIFHIGLSTGPPAQVPPLKIDLAPDAKPTRVKLRNYSMEQRSFMRTFVAEPMEASMVYSNTTAAWAAAPLLVPKQGPKKLRFTVDPRPVNKYTVRHQYPMPNLEQEISRLSGAGCFATFHLSHGYWQLPLHSESQALHSFITPDGIYSPTRALDDTTNAVVYLQSTLAEIIPAHLSSAFSAGWTTSWPSLNLRRTCWTPSSSSSKS